MESARAATPWCSRSCIDSSIAPSELLDWRGGTRSRRTTRSWSYATSRQSLDARSAEPASPGRTGRSSPCRSHPTGAVDGMRGHAEDDPRLASPPRPPRLDLPAPATRAPPRTVRLAWGVAGRPVVAHEGSKAPDARLDFGLGSRATVRSPRRCRTSPVFLFASRHFPGREDRSGWQICPLTRNGGMREWPNRTVSKGVENVMAGPLHL